MPRDYLFLNGLLGDVLRGLDLDKGVLAQRSLSLWEIVAGEAIARATRAGDIRNGTMYVYTRSSAWSQELSLLRETLVARLNAQLGSDVVKEIRFQVKRFKNEEPVAAPVANERDLSDAERAAVLAWSEAAGEEIGTKVASFAERQMRHQTLGSSCSACGGPVRDAEKTCPFCRGA
jgi:hypothetical protein